MIRLFALALVAAVSMHAHAEVKRPGTVLASICSTTISGSRAMNAPKAPKDVCFASIVGRKGSFLTTDSKVWEIVKTVQAGNATRLSLRQIGFINGQGQFEPMMATVMISAEATRSGSAAEDTKLFFQSKQAATFQARDFQIVYHTMSM